MNSGVGRDVNAAGNTLAISSTIGRNVNAQVGNKLQLLSGTAVRGGVYYTSPNMLEQASGARVSGKVVYHKSAVTQHRRAPGVAIVGGLFFGLLFIIFSMALVLLFPQLFGRWNRYAASHFWASLLTGFLAMIVVPVLIIVLLITVIGIPVALFVGLLWLLAPILSLPLTAFYTGHLVMRHERRAPLIMLVGAVILALVYLLPILVGW